MTDYIDKTIAAYNQSPEKYEASTTGMTPHAEFKRFIECVGVDGAVLDAGCAFGRDSTEFRSAGLVPTGIDLSDELLKKATATHSDIMFKKMDVRQLDFPDDSFNGVWCHATLLHLNDEDINKALHEFHRVLKSGGVIFVSFKKGEGSEEIVESFSSDAARYFNYKTTEAVRSLLQVTGFTDIDAYYINERNLFGPDKRDLDWVYCFSVKAG